MRILIGCCGGLTGTYLSRHIHDLSWIEEKSVLGFDVSDKNPTKYFLDELFVLPPVDSDGFVESLIYLLNSERIDIYIPTHSAEGFVVSRESDRIRKLTRTNFMISPLQTYEALDNKENLYNNLDELGIDTPKRFQEDIADFFLPLFIKPIRGSGSKNTRIISNREELRWIEKLKEDYLVTEYLQGKEYTVDTYFSLEGRLLGLNQRIRVKNLGGAAIITENNYDIEVTSLIETISRRYTIIGPANFQFFLTDNSRIVFTDVNLRFASGGLPLTIKSGLDIPEIMLKELSGMKIESNECVIDKKHRIMFRYFSEIFEEPQC
ncbi:hypothetical protein V511_10180 [Mesotoga sp. Brook.08.YT.4.2.5.1]|uniref:ATP-grasp domain-containing protein n=1 Tax=unclassified Mesotoga TaxID=1184398 RepID=UPI000C9A7F18|nr:MULTISPECIES: ATP-grasp domain-containing protein [unclassified Mesotoga]PNE20171.1 hypothetical protein V511_10180 [Mesotoga sp. Brook.08.YT.4.2.5.1]PNS40783.1 hypothetical protein RJ60_06145 [Mesotoga sp. B105.6.4]RAO96721.1 hypothetical protein M388_13165 [Mesotoga sp. Brook.08.YT.4.2.5.4.]RDI93308.1 hypothetical protein Q502_06490 [Mesotoga sp. Brook.08.YT.4.2.5.2.]